MICVVALGLRLILLLSVLIQYTPIRLCALERVVTGSSCHDRDASHSHSSTHADEWACGSRELPAHNCACEKPKAGAQHHPQDAKSPLDWAHISTPLAVVHIIDAVASPSAPEPDPRTPSGLALQLPLLI
jgi:hypothetical protein